jgi:hypothetical protein
VLAGPGRQKTDARSLAPDIGFVISTILRLSFFTDPRTAQDPVLLTRL